MSTYSPVPLAYCSGCGAEIPSGAKYCANCGQVVSEPQPSFPPPPPRLSTPVAYPSGGMLETGGGIGKLFSGSGRISRLEYFLTVVAVWIVLLIAWGIIVAVDAPALTIVLGVGTWLAAVVVSVCAGVKRLHDFDQSGWLYLLFLVPIASFILLFVLLLKGGSDGANQYGFSDSGSVLG